MLAVAVWLGTAGRAAGQIGWQVHPASPVLAPGGSQWDAVAVGQPSCRMEAARYRMWYAGAAADLRVRVLLAESVDGVAWQRHPAPLLTASAPGTWDAWSLDTPEVVRSPDRYHLYYYGQSSPDTADGSAIGLAVSEDGVTFDRSGDHPVLTPGAPGSWDERWVESPAVRRDPATGRWFMWYTGVDAAWVAGIGLATSVDGVRWVKHPANPVLSPGRPGAWDDYWAAVPAVLEWRSVVWLVYSGVSAADLADGTAESPAVGFACSLDGATWVRPWQEPVLGSAEVGAGGPWAPSMVHDPEGGRLLMWYETSAGIGLAIAPVPSPLRGPARTRLMPAAMR
jgi:predicted GH43/DUF377 family glycosyl hydrolase